MTQNFSGFSLFNVYKYVNMIVPFLTCDLGMGYSYCHWNSKSTSHACMGKYVSVSCCEIETVKTGGKGSFMLLCMVGTGPVASCM